MPVLEAVSKTFPEIFGIVIYNSSIFLKTKERTIAGRGKEALLEGENKKLPHRVFVRQLLLFSAVFLRAPAVPFCLIPPLQEMFFAARIYSRSAARHFRERPPVLPKGRTIPEKKASKPCSGHLFHRFLPILQCFL